jgi:hypothetical protein
MGQNSGGQPTQSGTGQQNQQPAQQGGQNQQPARNGQQNQQTRQQQAGRQATEQERDTGERIASWFTETFVRTAVALFGVALLLLALGQIVGVNLLSIVGDFLVSGIGAWIVIAFFAMLLIVAASKSWSISNQ